LDESSRKPEVIYTSIKFGDECSLRGKYGRYITAIKSIQEVDTTKNLKQPSSSNLIFPLGVNGQGIGESLDCILFVNADER
jgi:hypothetical protein